MNNKAEDARNSSGAEGISGRNRMPPYFSALAMALPAIMLGLQLSGWIGFLPVIRDGHQDFRNLYTAGYMVRVGHKHEIYNYSAQKMFQNALVSQEEIAIPFIRPAYQAVLFVPFSLLSFHWAYFAFFVFNIGILILCFRLLRPQMNNLARIWPGLPASMFLFLPIAAALMQGQDSIVLMALLSAALLCLEREREYLAGIFVAFGLFKFQLVLPVFILFLAWRRWRFSAAFACTAVMLVAVSVWIAGAQQSIDYFRSAIQISKLQNLSSGLQLPVDHMANLHGLVWATIGRSSLVFPVSVAISAIIIILAAIRPPQRVDALLRAIPVAALVSYYMFIHDMCILLIPIILSLNRLSTLGPFESRHRNIRMSTALLMFAAPACMSFIPNQFWVVSLPLLAFTLTMHTPCTKMTAVSTL